MNKNYSKYLPSNGSKRSNFGIVAFPITSCNKTDFLFFFFVPTEQLNWRSPGNKFVFDFEKAFDFEESLVFDISRSRVKTAFWSIKIDNLLRNPIMWNITPSLVPNKKTKKNTCGQVLDDCTRFFPLHVFFHHAADTDANSDSRAKGGIPTAADRVVPSHGHRVRVDNLHWRLWHLTKFN